MIKILFFTALLIVAAFGLSCSIPLSAVAATPLENEEHRNSVESLHPCGGKGLMLEGITGYFRYRWSARYADLDDKAVKTWVEYHKIQDLEVTLVRVFQSPTQPTMAVVSARKFENYLNGKPLVQMMCVVKMNTDEVTDAIALEYTPNELQKILSGIGADI
jgi:hypothetical protein